jgi:predicted ATPase with chaperone activity
MILREALETTKIHSVARKLKEVRLMNQRLFRRPHHTISKETIYFEAPSADKVPTKMNAFFRLV